MRNNKLYLDTSVLGGIFDIEDSERVATAKSLLKLIAQNKYEGYISYLTLLEVQKAPLDIKGGLERLIVESNLTILEETKECVELSAANINDKIIPEKYRDDARHIAIAVFYQMDYIISWNYRHMANINVIRLVNSVNLRKGFNPIDIVPPEEAIDYGSMET